MWNPCSVRGYSPTKLRESKPWQFRDSSLGVPGQKAIRMWVPRRGIENTIWGKVVASPESRPWWVLWVQNCPWLVLALNVVTLLGESVGMRLTLPKWGLGSSPGLPKVQSSITRVKTPRIGTSFISLERYWSVDVQTGLAWPIWTSATQVMAKRKAGTQIGSLTPDHGKSRIDSIPLRAGGVQHVVGKLSTRATTLV
jgi:hypothetical protein